MNSPTPTKPACTTPVRPAQMRTLVVVLLAAASLTAFANGDESTTYTPPFAEGPSGGDEYNLLIADPQGRVTAGRAYPQPGGISCAGEAGFVKLEVDHAPTNPVETVSVAFTEAAIDSYTFAVAAVRDANGAYLGSHQFRGPVGGDGTLEVPVEWPAGDPAFALDRVTIEFGLQLSGACPSVDGGTLRFTQVTVSEAHQD